MGTVFLAKQTDLDRLVAIKVLPPHLVEDEQFLSRFELEAKAVAKLIQPLHRSGLPFGLLQWQPLLFNGIH